MHSSCLENRNEKKIEGNDHRKKKFDEYKRKTPTSTLLLQYLEIETNAFNVIMHVGYKKKRAHENEKNLQKKNDGRNCPLLLLLLLLFCFLLQSLIFLTLLTEDRSKQRASI